MVTSDQVSFNNLNVGGFIPTISTTTDMADRYSYRKYAKESANAIAKAPNRTIMQFDCYTKLYKYIMETEFLEFVNHFGEDFDITKHTTRMKQAIPVIDEVTPSS